MLSEYEQVTYNISFFPLTSLLTLWSQSTLKKKISNYMCVAVYNMNICIWLYINAWSYNSHRHPYLLAIPDVHGFPLCPGREKKKIIKCIKWIDINKSVILKKNKQTYRSSRWACWSWDTIETRKTLWRQMSVFPHKYTQEWSSVLQTYSVSLLPRASRKSYWPSLALQWRKSSQWTDRQTHKCHQI